MTTFYQDKENLLRELKKETLNQYKAVQNQDPEEFLQKTEVCSRIIERLDAIRIPKDQINEQQEMEVRLILQEIAEVREQISNLIPPLQESLLRQAMAQEKKKFVKRQYKHENYSAPSIFLDKKV